MANAANLINFGGSALSVGDWIYSPTRLTAPTYLPMLDPTVSYLASSYPALAPLYTTPVTAYSATTTTPTLTVDGDKMIAYGNNIWVATSGTQQYQTSPDGITWTKRYFPTTATFRAIVYGNGIFIALAYGGTITYTSTDGLSWRSATLSPASNYTDIAYGNGIFIVVSGGNVTRQDVSISTDGVTWVGGAFLPSVTNWNAVTYGNGTFVAVAQGTTSAATSVNGINWTARTLPSAALWSSVTYGNGVFVAVSGKPTNIGAVNSTAAATSPNGTTWTATTLPVSQAWASVVFGNGLFFAVGYPSAGANTNAATSPDGATWTSRVMPASGFWGSIAVGGPPNDRFFVSQVLAGLPTGAKIALSVAQTTFTLPEMAPMRNVTPYIKAT